MKPLRAGLATITATAALLSGCASGPPGPHLETGGQANHEFGHVVDRTAACDFDGDGRGDFVVSGRAGEGRGATTVLVTGTGRFRSELTLEQDFADLTTGDFDADGQCDFAGLAGPTARNDARIFFGEGGHFPQTATRVARPAKARALTAGDITGDGVADLLVAYKTFRERANVAVFPGGPERANPGRTRMYRSPGNPTAVRAADLDGDGDTDLAVLRTDRRVTVLANRGGRLRARGTVAYGEASSAGPLRARLATGDFDGDGDADLAVTDARKHRLFLFGGDTRPTLAATFRFSDGPPVDLAPADLDGSGPDDLAVLVGEASPRLRVLRVRPTGQGVVNFAPMGGRALDGLETAAQLQLTDFDQSGPRDAAVWGAEDGTPYILSLRAVRIVTP
jgi:hypothetical protein